MDPPSPAPHTHPKLHPFPAQQDAAVTLSQLLTTGPLRLLRVVWQSRAAGSFKCSGCVGGASFPAPGPYRGERSQRGEAPACVCNGGGHAGAMLRPPRQRGLGRTGARGEDPPGPFPRPHMKAAEVKFLHSTAGGKEGEEGATKWDQSRNPPLCVIVCFKGGFSGSSAPGPPGTAKKSSPPPCCLAWQCLGADLGHSVCPRGDTGGAVIGLPKTCPSLFDGRSAGLQHDLRALPSCHHGALNADVPQQSRSSRSTAEWGRGGGTAAVPPGCAVSSPAHCRVTTGLPSHADALPLHDPPLPSSPGTAPAAHLEGGRNRGGKA